MLISGCLRGEHGRCLCVQRDLARSRQQVLKGEIVAFRRDLEGDMYKDADIKYRDKMIQLKVFYPICILTFIKPTAVYHA